MGHGSTPRDEVVAQNWVRDLNSKKHEAGSYVWIQTHVMVLANQLNSLQSRDTLCWRGGVLL